MNGESEVKSMATTLEELQVLITAETKGLRTELDAVKGQLNSTHRDVARATSGITSTVKKLGGVLAAVFAVKKIFDFGRASVRANSEIALSEAKLAVIMRQRMGATDAAVRSVKQLVEAQEALGLVGAGEQLAGAQQVATFLNSKQALDALIPAMNNLAAQQRGYNATAEDMVNIGNMFGKVMQGQTGALSRVGITFTEAEERVLKYGTELEKAAMLAKIIENNVGNMNAELAKTPQGQWEQISNTFAAIKETVGKGIMTALNAVLPYLRTLGNYLLRVAQYFTAFMTAIFGASRAQTQAANAAAQAQLGVADAVTQAGEAAKGATAGFDVFNDISSQGPGDVGAVGGGALTLPEFDMGQIDLGEDAVAVKVQSLVDKIRGMWGSGVSAIVDIGSSLQEAFTKPIKSALDMVKPELSAFRDSVGTNLARIIELGVPLKSWFTDHLVPYWQRGIEANGMQMSGWLGSLRMVFDGVFNAAYPVLEWFVVSGLPLLTSFADGSLTVLMALWSAIKNIFDTLWSKAVQPGLELLSRIVVDTLNIVRDRWYQFGDGIVNRLVTAIERMQQMWTAFWENFLQPIVNTIIETVTWLWDKHLKDLVEQLLVFIGKLIEGARDIYNKFILPIATWLIERFGPAFSNTFQFVIEVAGTLIAFVADMARSILKSLGGIIDFIAGVFTGDWRRAWQGVKDFFGGIWDGMVGTVKAAMNLIIDFVNWAIRGLNSLSIDVPKGVPIIGGIKFGLSIPAIPKLATGGLAYGATLAMVGDNLNAGVDPEVISPLSTLRNIILEALMQKEIATGGRSQELRLTMLMDSDVLIDMLIDVMNRRATNLGYAPVFKPAN